MSSSLCGSYSTGAGTLVSQGWNRWSKFATDAVEDVGEYLVDLSALNLTPVEVKVPFNVPFNLGDPFSPPPSPDLPDMEPRQVRGVGDISIGEINIPTFDSPPEFEGKLPSIELPDPVAPITVQPPGDVPVVSDQTLPPEPVLDTAEVPTLLAIELPTAPTIVSYSFTDEQPLNDIVVPGNTFSFTEEEYESSLLNDLIDRVTVMLAGGTGLPDNIWNAIWNRASGNEERTAAKAVDEVNKEWASRGFSLPTGAQAHQVMRVRQQNQDAINQFNRELAIKQAEMEVENLRFAVQQSATLEATLINQHMQIQQRSFEAARYAFQVTVDIFNSKISLYNASIQAWATSADVFRTKIQAEQLKLEQYKTELEGQQLIGTINQQAITLYNSQLEGLRTAIDLYNSQLKAVQTKIEIDKANVDIYRAQIDAYAAQIQAKNTEYQGYAEAIKGELAKAQLYDAEVKAYASRIQAYGAETDAYVSQSEIKIKNEQLKVSKYASQLERYKGDVQAESARIDSLARIYASEATMYNAELSAEAAKVASNDRQFQLALQEATTEAELYLKQADLNIQQLLRIYALESDNLKTISNIQSNLAASAMSAVSLGASIRNNADVSRSCSVQHSYQY